MKSNFSLQRVQLPEVKFTILLSAGIWPDTRRNQTAGTSYDIPLLLMIG
jgi:hypothetical protein